jgi:hypothetical protein
VTSREEKSARWLRVYPLFLFLFLLFFFFFFFFLFFLLFLFLFLFCLFFDHDLQDFLNIILLFLLPRRITFRVGELLGLPPFLLYDILHIRLIEFMDCSLKRGLPTALIV